MLPKDSLVSKDGVEIDLINLRKLVGKKGNCMAKIKANSRNYLNRNSIKTGLSSFCDFIASIICLPNGDISVESSMQSSL